MIHTRLIQGMYFYAWEILSSTDVFGVGHRLFIENIVERNDGLPIILPNFIKENKETIDYLLNFIYYANPDLEIEEVFGFIMSEFFEMALDKPLPKNQH